MLNEWPQTRIRRLTEHLYPGGKTFRLSIHQLLLNRLVQQLHAIDILFQVHVFPRLRTVRSPRVLCT
jgi:hypothetical protein